MGKNEKRRSETEEEGSDLNTSPWLDFCASQFANLNCLSERRRRSEEEAVLVCDLIG